MKEEKYNKKKKTLIAGCASLLTIIMLVGIFSIQFTINKTSNLKQSQIEQLINSSKYIVSDLNNEELPVKNSDGSEITKQTIDGKDYYIVSTDESGNITDTLEEGIYKVIRVDGTDDDSYTLTEESSYIKVSDDNQVSEIEVQEFNIINKYVGPVITSKKEYTTEYNKEFVIEGEKITYKITVENTGKMEKDVIIKDTIPDGTTFVEGTITVTPEQEGKPASGYTKQNLEDGIHIKVPGVVASEPEEEQDANETTGSMQADKQTVVLTFQVQVNELDKGKYSKEIDNVAEVDGKETPKVTVMVNKELPVQLNEIEVVNTYIGPIITEDKSFTTQYSQSSVKEGEEITYSITVENSGEVAKDVVIKDKIPAGTTFKEGSVKINNLTEYTNEDGEGNSTEEITKDILENTGVKVTVPASTPADEMEDSRKNGKVTLTFVVTVDQITEGTTKSIENTATVDDVPTRKVIVIAEKEIDGQEKEITINKKDSVTKEGLQDVQFTLTPYAENVAEIQNVKVKPSMKVTKAITSNPKGEQYVVDERIKYSITIENTGNVALTDVQVTDNTLTKIENTTSTLYATFTQDNQFELVEDLLPGEKRVVTYDYVITQEDVDGEQIDTKLDLNTTTTTVTAKALTPTEDDSVSVTTSVAEQTGEGNEVDTFTFTKTEEKLQSSNKKANSKAIAIVPINVTSEYSGKHTLVINAGISSKVNDIGLAMLVEGEAEAINYDDYSKAFMAISGKRDAKDYKVTLENGKKYTLILMYVKDGENAQDEEEDVFTVNSIKVVQNETGKQDVVTLTTQEDGTVTQSLPYGRYELRETQTKEGYKQLEQPITIEIGEPNKIVENKNVDVSTVEVKVEGDEFIVYNTLEEAKITGEKSATTTNSKNYVVADETITYTITAKNLGAKEKEITIQDNIPDGTTFKQGSIKVNNDPNYQLDGTSGDKVNASEKTEDDLRDGIKVTVPASTADEAGGRKAGEIKLSFEVTVDELTEEDDHTKTITNQATVDGQKTKEVEHTVSEAELEYEKTSDKEGTVKAGDEITYTIKVRNTGTAATDVKIKDQKPDHTTYKEENVTVNKGPIAGISLETKTTSELEEGITVNLEPNEEVTVQFTVTVDADGLNDGDEIENTAYINDTLPTDTITHTYVEPVISYSKKHTTEHPERDYVQEGERITYTIEVKNEGGLAKDVTIKDDVPDGTTLDGDGNLHIEVNGVDQTESHTMNELKQDGITITVPPAEDKNQNSEISDDEVGKVTVSFTVTVDELLEGTLTGEIKNTATVDGQDTTEDKVDIKNSNITANKTAVVTAKAGEELGDNKVQKGDKINYKIVLNNTLGVVEELVVVKDNLPEKGIETDEESFKVVQLDADDGDEEGQNVEGTFQFSQFIEDGITITVPAGKKIVISYTVTVTGTGLQNGEEIKNTAYVNDNPTEDVTHTFVEPIIEGKKSVKILTDLHGTEVNDREFAEEGDTLEYTITAKNKGGLEKEVTIADQIPDGLEFVEESIKIDPAENIVEPQPPFTQDQLASGIKVKVPAAKDATFNQLEVTNPGKVTLTFRVKVKDLGENVYSKTIINKATVDGVETTEVPIEVDKSNVRMTKTAEPASGEKVSAGEKITYTIVITNEKGTADTNVKVQDSIPDGTTYEPDTLKITSDKEDHQLNEKYEITELEQGINLTLAVKEKITITFEVKVNDEDDEYLTDGEKITNIAQITENPDSEYPQEPKTSTVEHTYVEPIISSEKTAETTNKKGYVSAVGDEITYTITLTNEGGLEKEVAVKDVIPARTTYKEGSLEVKSGESVEEHEITELTGDGLKVTVPAATMNEVLTKVNGTATIKFTVTLNEAEFANVKEFANTATVNKDPEKNPDPEEPIVPEDIEKPSVTTPVVTFTKEAQVTKRRNEEMQDDSKVTVGDEITYTIKVNNLSEKESAKNIEVKDILPEGVELANAVDTEEGNVIAHYDADSHTITWTIKELAKQTTENLTFVIRVKYTKEAGTKILNKATVDGKDTNTTEKEYEKPIPQTEDNLTKEAKIEKVVSKDAKVYYELNFTATVTDFVGKAKITIVDTLPYPIDKNNSELSDGEYKETDNDDGSKTYTITWVDEVEDIDTFTKGQAQEIKKTKTLQLQYIYGTLDGSQTELRNEATYKLELIEPKDDPEEDKVVKTVEPDEPVEETIPIEIESTVTTHHYIYDENQGGKTDTQLAKDETQTGKIGDPYTTDVSAEIPANYKLKEDETEGEKEGVFSDTDKEVTYYYELTTPTVSSEIDKNAKVEGAVTLEEGTKKLTKEGGAVKYDITYTAHVKDYIGKVTVEIVDTLPAPIDTTKSELQGGHYDPDTNTITWTETINGVDTYANTTGEYSNGTFTRTIVKNISLVYIVDDDPVGELENSVTGSTKVYYPDGHTTDPGEEQDPLPEDPDHPEDPTDTEIIEQDYKVKLSVEKVWDDEENHPNSIYVNITADDAIIGEDGVRKNYSKKQLLNADNNWKYTEEDEVLQKYDKYGTEIDYVVTEEEASEGDLDAYGKPKIEKVAPSEGQESTDKNDYIVRVTNSYVKYDKDLDQEMTKEVTKINDKNYGTEKDDTTQTAMTSADDAITYRIKFTANLADYEGQKAKLTIEDILPYAIDESDPRVELNGGVYEEVEDTATGDIKYKITWTDYIEGIRVDAEGTFTDTKDVTVVFKDIDVTETELVNTAEGRLLLDSEKNGPKAETSTTLDTDIQGTVIVKYVEVDENGEEIGEIEGVEQETLKGTIGDSYNTDTGTNEAGEKLKKDIPGYVLEDSENTEGEFGKDDKIVKYYYRRAEAKVTVKYVDEDGNEIEDPQIKTGKVGDPYDTSKDTSDDGEKLKKDIPGYELVEVPNNEKGTLTEDDQEVVYKYRKLVAKVVVQYLEKGTNKPVAPEETIEGKVGDVYQTSRKVVKNYKSAEPEPTNASGKMTKETITVTYYYEKVPSGKITVKYLDVDTKEDLTYTEIHEDGTMEEKKYGYEIEGNAGDKYTTEQPEIPYYNLFKVPENASGELTEDGDTVIYYYKKKPFNFSIEKVFKSVILNGEVKNLTNNQSAKVEIVAATIGYAKLEVSYKIIVRNTGEIAGKAKVVEMLPNGYKAINLPNYWAQTQDGSLEALVELKAGETKELEVTTQWINGDSNFGIFENTAKLVDLENEANFKEISEDDNSSTAELITSIKTGVEENIILISTGIGLIITLCVLVYLYEKYNNERGIPMRKITIENKKIVIKKDK